jgi:hypothetical protein
MNPIQEEHRIHIPKDYNIGGSFTGLWRMIALQQHFLKLTLSHPNPTKEEMDEIIKHRHGSISPYSLSVFSDYIVIFKKGNTCIITNRPTQLFGTFFAVEDTDWENRYFIAFAFSVGCLTESITGMMVYFREDGLSHADHITIYDRVIVTYDLRNGKIRSSEMVLYHQTLLFLQSHRDSHNMILYLTHLLYDSDKINTSTSYYTQYAMTCLFPEDIHIHKRFVLCPMKEGQMVIDMGSLDLKKEDDRTIYLSFYSYVITSRSIFPAFLEMAVNFPEKPYSDGYPTECIQCGKTTSAATFYFKRSPSSYVTSGMGNSYCDTCRIRYSHTKKEWVCANIDIRGYTCDGILPIGSLCQNMITHSSDQTCILIQENRQYKYPYRNYVRLQWIPSDDAREAMTVAMFGKTRDRSLSDSMEENEEDDGHNSL